MNTAKFNEIADAPGATKHKPRGRSKTLPTILVLSLLVLAGAFAMRKALGHVDRRLDAELEESAVRQLQEVPTLEAIRLQQTNLELRAALAVARSHDGLRSNIVAMLTNALPPRTSLLQIELGAPDVARSEISTARANADESSRSISATTHLTLVGVARTDAQVNEYASAIARLGSFNDLAVAGMSFADLNSESAREFQIRINLLPLGDHSVAANETSALPTKDEAFTLTQ